MDYKNLLILAAENADESQKKIKQITENERKSRPLVKSTIPVGIFNGPYRPRLTPQKTTQKETETTLDRSIKNLDYESVLNLAKSQEIEKNNPPKTNNGTPRDSEKKKLPAKPKATAKSKTSKQNKKGKPKKQIVSSDSEDNINSFETIMNEERISCEIGKKRDARELMKLRKDKRRKGDK